MGVARGLLEQGGGAESGVGRIGGTAAVSWRKRAGEREVKTDPCPNIIKQVRKVLMLMNYKKNTKELNTWTSQGTMSDQSWIIQRSFRDRSGAVHKSLRIDSRNHSGFIRLIRGIANASRGIKEA